MANFTSTHTGSVIDASVTKVSSSGVTQADLTKLNAVTSSATELNILDGVTATAAEINLLDGLTATTAELNILDGVTSTAAELNVLDGYTGSVTELNYLDTLHATGVTATEFDFLDGVTSNIQTQLDAKIEATLTSEQVQDIVGAMFSSNTESGVTVTYEDSDGTIDLSVATQSDNNFTTTLLNKLNAIEASATADQTASEIRTLVDSASDSNVFTDADHSKLDGIEASATADQTNAEIRTAVEAASDSNVFTDADHSKLNAIEASADVTDTANVTSAGALMDSELTSIADVKALDQSVVSGASPTFGTANMTDASNKRFMTDAQETKLDSVESNATADQTDEEIQDVVGAMFSGNTETGITATYQDGDGTIDLVVGTLNQDTTGNAATATKIASITNSDIVQLTDTQTLTNKTLASPTFTGDVMFNDASTPVFTVKDTTNNVTADFRATDTLSAIGTNTDNAFYLKQNGAFQVNINSNQIILNSSGEDRNTIIKDDSGTAVFKVDAGTSKTEISTLLLDSVSINAIQSSGESFADNDTSLMTSAAINDKIGTEVASLVDSAPGTLDTLNELAAALGDDANFSTTTATSLGNRLRVDTASQGLTGTQQANAITNLGITSTKAELNILDGVTSTAAELNILDGVTSTAAELNVLDGITSTTAELNILDGVTATAAELNIMDGVTATTAELNFVDGVTSNIQTQLDATLDTAGTGIDISSTTISVDVSDFMANGSDNRILTATGADAMNAEANLTFDGTDLAIASGGKIEVDKVEGQSNNTNALFLDDDQSGASNMVSLQSINHINIMTDGNNNGTGNFRVYNGSYDTDTADLAFQVDSVGNTFVYGDLNISGYIYDSANSGNRLDLDDDSDSGQGNQVALYGINHLNLVADNTNNGTGEIRFWKGSVSDLDSATNTRLMTIDNSGNVTFNAGDVKLGATKKLYLDGGSHTYIQESSADKISIVAGGVTLLDIDEANDMVHIPQDNHTLRIGSGSDLRLWHSGSDTFIRNDTGDFYISNDANDKDLILRSDDGSGGQTAYITLDGSATRVDVSQDLRIPSDSKQLKIGASEDLLIYHDGSNSHLQNGTGTFFLNQVANSSLILQTNNTEAIRITNSQNVGIGTSSPAGKLEIKHTSATISDPHIAFEGSGGETDDFAIYAPSGENTLRFGYSGSGEDTDILTIQRDSATSGSVGIGTSSPAHKLEVEVDTNVFVGFDNSIGGTTGDKIMFVGWGGSNAYGRIQPIHQGTAFKDLVLNDSGGNVGIGTTSPDGKLNIDVNTSAASGQNDDASNYSFVLNCTSGSSTGHIERHIGFRDPAGDVVSAINAVDDGASGATGITFATGNVTTLSERLRIDANGNMRFSDNDSNPSAAANTAFLFNDGGEMKVLDELGNTTTISPHNFELIPDGASEDMAFAYHSTKHTPEGKLKKVNVDMMKLARLVEQLTGEKLVYIEEGE